MSVYGKFVNKITYPLLASRDGWGQVKKKMGEFEESQYWSSDKLREYQLSKIKQLLTHAYQNSPFYRQRFDDAGFRHDQFQDFDNLSLLPPLKKTDLQNNLSNLVAKNFSVNQIHKDATGGSTGNHTPFYRDNNCLGVKKAIEYRCNRWAGWDIGEKVVYYWPAIQDFAPKKTLKAKIKNQLMYRSLMLYAGSQNEQILKDHYTQLSSFRPQLMRTFPNPLAVLAKYIQESGKPTPHIPSIISVGEPLLESHRKLFEEVFGAKVYNCYVSRECGNMACECGEKSGLLHVNAEMVYIEPLGMASSRQDEPTKLLVTDLTNYGMPIIRYQIEDLGVFSDDGCECGKGLPVFRMEAGRVSDFLISPYDKSRISGCSFLHHLIAEGPEVGQIQVIQDKIDHLKIKIVKSRGFHKDKLVHFDKVVENIFKGKMKYTIEYTEKIEREKSKKYFFTKCLILNDEN